MQIGQKNCKNRRYPKILVKYQPERPRLHELVLLLLFYTPLLIIVDQYLDSLHLTHFKSKTKSIRTAAIYAFKTDDGISTDPKKKTSIVPHPVFLFTITTFIWRVGITNYKLFLGCEHISSESIIQHYLWPVISYNLVILRSITNILKYTICNSVKCTTQRVCVCQSPFWFI